ncbi:MAG: hypothetical protein R2828_25795 [Saprospiraceae bacterium]
MDYKKKIKYAEGVAIQLQEQKSIELIKSELKSEGLYDPDINKVMISARKIIGEKFQPKIHEFLLNNKQIHGSEEFKLLDNETLNILIDKESRKIALEKKQEIAKLIREGKSEEEVFAQVDTRFMKAETAVAHITQLQEIKRQNSGSGRMINIFGGLGLIVLTIVLLFTIDRLFYILPIIGLIMIVRGFTTEKVE